MASPAAARDSVVWYSSALGKKADPARVLDRQHTRPLDEIVVAERRG